MSLWVSKEVSEHQQFGEKYPIFVDTSAIKLIDSGKTATDLKREREDETFSYAPAPTRPRAETFSDLQSSWALQETDFKRQIDDYKKKYHDVMEQNHLLAEQAVGNQNHFESIIAKLESKVSDLEVAKTEQEIEEDFNPLDVVNELRQENEDLKGKMEEFLNAQNRPAQIAGLSESIMETENNEDAIKQAVALIDKLESKNTQLGHKWTLGQVGMTAWNPSTTAFLDYLISFRSVMNVSKMSHAKAVQLLFSALPSKYSYVRGIVYQHPDYAEEDYFKTEALLIKLIVGGREKIFTSFVGLQKKNNETLLEYFQKVCDFYLFSYSDAQQQDRTKMNEDAMSYKLIKNKMVQAFPNRLVTDFKRRLESKSKLTEIFDAILEMKDQFSEFEFENSNMNDYNGAGLNVMVKKKSDWKKTVKCFHCGKKGHIKRECYKRESKTKKSGSSGSK